MSDLTEAVRFIEKVANGECELSVAVKRAITALERACEEADYCYVCDNHPSHGHAKGCALV